MDYVNYYLLITKLEKVPLFSDGKNKKGIKIRHNQIRLCLFLLVLRKNITK